MHGADLEDEQEAGQLMSLKFGACSPGMSALLLLALLPLHPVTAGQEFSFAPRVLRTHSDSRCPINYSTS